LDFILQGLEAPVDRVVPSQQGVVLHFFLIQRFVQSVHSQSTIDQPYALLFVVNLVEQAHIHIRCGSLECPAVLCGPFILRIRKKIIGVQGCHLPQPGFSLRRIHHSHFSVEDEEFTDVNVEELPPQPVPDRYSR
jgi:hypothetical protein